MPEQGTVHIPPLYPDPDQDKGPRPQVLYPHEFNTRLLALVNMPGGTIPGELRQVAMQVARPEKVAQLTELLGGMRRWDYTPGEVLDMCQTRQGMKQFLRRAAFQAEVEALYLMAMGIHTEWSERLAKWNTGPGIFGK